MSSNDLKKTKAIMDDAIELRNQSQTAKAIAYLLAHASMLQSSGAACGLLASLYWDQNDFRKSARWFSKAVALSPRSEMASLGLFHSLWNVKKYDDAFDEMRRFILVGETKKEYKRLLKELTKELSFFPSTLRLLSIEDRYTIVDAEHVGLDWRSGKNNTLTPIESLELQHA